MVSSKLRTPNSADNWSAKIRKTAFEIVKSEAHGFEIYSFLCITAAFEKETDQRRA